MLKPVSIVTEITNMEYYHSVIIMLKPVSIVTEIINLELYYTIIQIDMLLAPSETSLAVKSWVSPTSHSREAAQFFQKRIRRFLRS